MEWTESHDVALCKEVLVQNPFLARKKTVQRAAIWQKIADELVSLSRPKFKVILTKRSVQDRLLLIITNTKEEWPQREEKVVLVLKFQSLTNH